MLPPPVKVEKTCQDGELYFKIIVNVGSVNIQIRICIKKLNSKMKTHNNSFLTFQSDHYRFSIHKYAIDEFIVLSIVTFFAINGV